MSLDKYVQRLVPTYEEFLKSRVKYSGDTKCFVYDCDKPGLYEGGDERYYCGMCEEHSAMRTSYRMYLGALISDANYMLSCEELYDMAQRRLKKLQHRLDKALEEQDGSKFSKTEQNLS